MTDYIILALPFIFGAVVGSFLNVCIYRVPARISIVTPSSRCPVCKRHIPFYLNIPVLSYIVLGGKCRYCRVPISWQYPLVELLTGFSAIALFMWFWPAPEVFFYFAFLCALIVITFIDLEHRIIPDVISIPGVVIGFGASFFTAAPGPLGSLIGIVLGGAVLMSIAAAYYFITGKEGMGGGDIKLLAMIGAFVGWKGVLFTLFSASLIGAVFGVAIIVISGKGGKYALPFGPFLAAGAAVYIFYGHAIVGWYILRFSGAI
ncbi:MAG: A24 family peptidase [Thermodesulfobacteriota bacterium]|nr:MAG: A24 family peptidase [Thermodesulfobacteriota bacterium]